MPAVPLSALLTHAVKERYALAGLVCLGWEDACAYVEASEETGIPIILQAGPGARKHMPIAIMGKMLRHLADQASVDIAVHVDHATTRDECRAGMDHGFTSVMFDGSSLPLDENIEKTAEIVALAKPHGISVEGEVGFVGYAGSAVSKGTDPHEAKRFERETLIDALAISIGNVHLQTAPAADIDFNRLEKIEANTSVPLVLHGGSGLPVETRKRLAMESRVSKFNIGTELRMAFASALRKSLMDMPEEFDRNRLLTPTIEAVRRATVAVITPLRHPERR